MPQARSLRPGGWSESLTGCCRPPRTRGGPGRWWSHWSAAPLIPPRFFTSRTRVTANVVSVLFAAAFFAYIFLLTLFEQQVLGYTPLTGGLSYLPFGAALGGGMAAS